MVELPFRDRRDAARKLGAALGAHALYHPLVLAIPRGGVPIGRIVADMLGGELDLVLVHKLGAPGNPEVAIGAVDENGTMLLDPRAFAPGVDYDYVNRTAQRERETMQARRSRYLRNRRSMSVEGRTVIVVDDGLATGATMASALHFVRARKPARLVCAVPVAAADSLAVVARNADETVCLATPSPFSAVGAYYQDFSAVDDTQVAALLGVSAGDDVAERRTPRVATFR